MKGGRPRYEEMHVGWLLIPPHEVELRPNDSSRCMRKSHSQHKKGPKFPVGVVYVHVYYVYVCGRHLHMIWLGAQKLQGPHATIIGKPFWIDLACLPWVRTACTYPLLCVMSCRASNELLRVSTQPFPLCPQGAKAICQSDGQLDRGSYTCDGRAWMKENFRYAPCGIHGALGHRFLTAMKKKKSVTMDCLAASVVCHHSRERDTDADTYHIHFNFHFFFLRVQHFLSQSLPAWRAIWTILVTGF